MHIFFFTSYDLSGSEGGSINEREFLLCLDSLLRESGGSLTVLSPEPANVFEMPEGWITYKIAQRRNSFRYALSIRSIVRDALAKARRPDLFVMRPENDNLLVPPTLVNLGIPFALKTLEDIYRFFRGSDTLKARLLVILIRRYLRYALLRAKLIDVCTPEYVKLYSERFGLSNVTLVDNGVNVARFRPQDQVGCKARWNLADFSPLLGYCGIQPADRGVREFITCLPALAKEYPNVGLAVACRSDRADEQSESLRKLAMDLGVKERVRFIGEIPYESVPSFICATDLGIALDLPERVRTIGNASLKIRQYVASGVPIIAAKGTNASIATAGICNEVTPSDADEVLHAAREILARTPGERSERALESRKFAEENLAIEVTCKQRLDLWRTIVG
ncbi:MAG: glycosyltransferase [Planctomycetes bacterium]|nr:glycosyltransferase [Planctomycetota bacterium]